MSGGSDAILERMMALHPKIIDLTLDRVWTLLDRLGNPQDRLPPVIHIAGTNGKGSTLAMIRAGLEGSGKSCHAYTSPHLARFHERIRLRGTLISEADLSDVLDECERANAGDPITYFEITTVAALLAFSRIDADYCLLEVGLGGRLDATNVVARPEVTVITPVSRDHTQFLGESVAEIAGEKAGIIKRGVPVVVAGQSEAALDVIEAQAARLSAPCLAQSQHWHVAEERGRLIYHDETGLLDLPPPALLGQHQFQNGGTAITVLKQLGCGEPAFEAALRDVAWPARMQRLASGPLIDAAPSAEFWLDGGHNAACGLALAESLTRLPKRPTHLVCGMMRSKDIAGYLRPLAARAEGLVAVDIPGEENAIPAADLRRLAQEAGIDASSAPSVAQAVTDIVAKLPQARILICGSLYLAGAILRENG